MTRLHPIHPPSLAALLGAALLSLAAPSAVQAQASAPDIRNIRPIMMLLVDTSGSMERVPSDGVSEPGFPICDGPGGSDDDRNRWALVLESLTGSWNDFYCDTQVRTDPSFSGFPDFNYSRPYHRPPLGETQNEDGILDAYIDRLKFGLMTFDTIYTYTDGPFLVGQSQFNARIADNGTTLGGWSYGEQRTLTYPGCTDTFMVDVGARNATGGLVGVGSDSDDHRLINAQIQTQLLNTRPQFGTPTAALLDDLRVYLNTDPDVATGGDPYAQCRDRYALILTDGQPSEPFREARYDCEAVDGCPYDRASTIAADLCQYDGTRCQGLLDGVFVVALDVNDTAAVAELNDIALVGGTDDAFLANNRPELLEALSTALDLAAPGTTTRARPAFVSGSGGGAAVQFDFNAGFQIGALDDEPWSGVLERTRFVCNSTTLQPEQQPLAPEDSFHEVLNDRANQRRLLTVVTSDAVDLDNNIIGAAAGSVPLGATTPDDPITGATISDFQRSNGQITPAHLGAPATDMARRDAIINWVHADPGSPREDNRLGDIYHSSPVAIGAPRVDLGDESFNAFRLRTDVAERPTMIYVGTNDGVLHAFVAEETTTSSGTTYNAGTELWGFIPPVLLPQLNAASASHQVTLDGTAVVKEVFFRRVPGDGVDGGIYHTVLIMGFRGGATGYFALDITDPVNPQFLWQFIGDRSPGTEMGNSFGMPGVGQVLVDVAGTLQERAIAILPGGSGQIDAAAASAAGATGCPAAGVGAADVTDGTSSVRSNLRCWEAQGRILYVVDIATGEIIRTIDEQVFNSPLTGSVSLYPGDVGTIAQRAFLTDDDGVLWRLDLSSQRPGDWEAEPFHDMFWNAGATDGQPANAAPVISTDSESQLVILQATGDIDVLDSNEVNRVVSITERRNVDVSGSVTYDQELNWEVVMQAGEQVTGPIELFEGVVYFSSFYSPSGLTDACSVGTSRIWGVDFREDGGSPPAGYSGARFPAPRFESLPGSGTFDEHFRGPFDNQLILGVGVTQRPTCVDGTDQFDPYIGQRFQVTNVGGGTFELRALVSGGTRVGQPDGSQVATISEELNRPAAYSAIEGFAGRADY